MGLGAPDPGQSVWKTIHGGHGGNLTVGFGGGWRVQHVWAAGGRETWGREYFMGGRLLAGFLPAWRSTFRGLHEALPW